MSNKSAEADPLGRDAGTYSPYNSTPPQRLVEYKTYPGYSDLLSANCVSEGISIPCSMVNEAMVRCPNDDCGPRRLEFYAGGQHTGSGVSMPFQAFADGYAGFLPPGATYLGRGEFRYGKNMPGITFPDGPTKGRLNGKYSHAVFQDNESPYNNCYQFVDHLVKTMSGIKLQSTETVSGRKANRMLVEGVGQRLISEAWAYKFINNGFEGFKDVLTSGFQGAGVYGHVLLQSGFYLFGGSVGTMLSAGFDVYDRWQEGLTERRSEIYPHRENDQRTAEVAGNEAGWKAGQYMWSYITGHRDVKVLKEDLTKVLCKPVGGT